MATKVEELRKIPEKTMLGMQVECRNLQLKNGDVLAVFDVSDGIWTYPEAIPFILARTEVYFKPSKISKKDS